MYKRQIGNEIYGNGYYSTNEDWEYDLHYSEASAANRVRQPALSPVAYGSNAVQMCIRDRLSPPPRSKSKKIKLPDFAARQKRIFGDKVLPGNIVAEERESYEW